MGEGFIPLDAYLRAPASDANARGAGEKAAAAATGPVAAAPDRPETRRPETLRAVVLQELALMRLAALEGYERARRGLLESLASTVLARELLLAPADIEALVRSALDAFGEREPVAIVLAPQDAEGLSLPFPVSADPALERGDVVVEVRDGELRSTFQFRAREAVEVAGQA